MEEYTTEDFIANWKRQRARQEGKQLNIAPYRQLQMTVSELEDLIVKELPRGDVLYAYGEVSKNLKQCLDETVYKEILRIYELCNGHPYFKFSELESVMHLKTESKTMKPERFVQVCMDLISLCPAYIDTPGKLSSLQLSLFKMGEPYQIWSAFGKNFYPGDILEELYEEAKKSSNPCIQARLPWIVAWMSA